MFRQGIVTFFDEGLAQGFIELKTDHQRIVFTLEDFSNTSVLPQIGERVKCVVVEHGGAQFAKFIVRLDHRNAVDRKPSQQVTNEDSLSENARNARKILKKRRIQEEGSKDQPTGTASENQSTPSNETQLENKHEFLVSNIAELTKVAGLAVSDLSKQGLTKIDVDEKKVQHTTSNLKTDVVQHSETVQDNQQLKQEENSSTDSESIFVKKLKNVEKSNTKSKKKTGKNKKTESIVQNQKNISSEQSQVELAVPATIIPASTVAPAVVRARIENALVNLLIPNEQKQAELDTSQNHSPKLLSEEIESIQKNPPSVSSVDLTQLEIESKSQDPNAKAQLFTQAAKVKVKQQNDLQDDISVQQQSDHSYRVVKSVSNIQTVNMQFFEHNKVYQAVDDADSNLESPQSVPEISQAQSLVVHDLPENTIESEPIDDLKDEVLATEIQSLEIVPSINSDHKNEPQEQFETPNEKLNTDIIDLNSSVFAEQGVEQITLQQNEFGEPPVSQETKTGVKLEPEVFKEEILNKETINQAQVNQEALNIELSNKETLNKEVPKSYKLPEHITQQEDIVLKHNEQISQLLSESTEVEPINLVNIEEPQKHASHVEPSEPNILTTNESFRLDHVPASVVEDQTALMEGTEVLPIENKLLNKKPFDKTSSLKSDLAISLTENNLSGMKVKQQDSAIPEVPVLDFTPEINAPNSVQSRNTTVNSYAQNQLDRQLIEQRMYPSAWQKMIQNLKVKFLYSKHKKQQKPILAKTSVSFNPAIIVMFALLLLSVSVVIYAVDYYRHYKSESALKLQQYEKEQKQRIKEQKREAQRH